MLKIGWGRREISLEGPVTLFGQMYMRISTGVLDPCYATALCVQGAPGQDTVIFCSLDVEGMRCGFIDRTKAEVLAICPEVPVDSIVLNVTHTHTGGNMADTPDVSPDGVPIIPGAEYRAFAARRAAEAICEAWTNRQEGGMAFGYGYAVVAHSRRTIFTEDKSLISNDVAPNGNGVMYGNTDDPTFSHYEAGADHFMNLMFTFDRHRKLTGIVINVPCPSQLSEHMTMMSADYWHNVRELAAKEYGPDVFILPQCAPAGDLSPRVLHYKEAQARRMALKYNMHYDPAQTHVFNKFMSERMDIAQRIMDSIREVYEWAGKDIRMDAEVYHVSRRLELSRRRITDQEKQWCAWNLERVRDPRESGGMRQVREEVSMYESVRDRNLLALERYEEQKTVPTVSTVVHGVRIGDIAFATNRFELFMDYMHRIQARSPFVQTFMMQLAGDEGANYLTTSRGEENRGYSASLFDNPVSPEGGQQLVEGILDMLQELKEKNI
jgi:hypothetical protein